MCLKVTIRTRSFSKRRGLISDRLKETRLVHINIFVVIIIPIDLNFGGQIESVAYVIFLSLVANSRS